MKLLDLVPSWAWAVAVSLVLAFAGTSYVRMKIAQTELATYRAEVAENTAKAEAAARAKERAWQKQNERVAQNAMEKQTELAQRAAAAALAADSLRDQIDRLNARTSPTDPAAAGFANEASAARKLLGQCAKAYRSLAERAVEFRDQVTGLQDWAKVVTAE
jgi:hypothetical protein